MRTTLARTRKYNLHARRNERLPLSIPQLLHVYRLHPPHVPFTCCVWCCLNVMLVKLFLSDQFCKLWQLDSVTVSCFTFNEHTQSVNNTPRPYHPRFDTRSFFFFFLLPEALNKDAPLLTFSLLEVTKRKNKQTVFCSETVCNGFFKGGKMCFDKPLRKAARNLKACCPGLPRIPFYRNPNSYLVLGTI